MKICFLDSNPNPYSSNDLYSNNVRGAESILINLANNFKNLGHEVFVFNNILNKTNINGVEWNNIKKLNHKNTFDLAITNNDMRLFNNIDSKKKIALSHSVQNIEKFIRKKQLYAYIKHKPKIVFMGKYHQSTRNFFLKIFGYINVNWPAETIFSNYKLIENIDKYKAIFTSYKDRNLNILIDIWKNYIFKKNKKLKLYITPTNYDLRNFNIFNRKFLSKEIMINEMITSRLFLIPGHKAELFCFAAEEARELCIPIVTLGIGSLSERVEHNKTGFIAKNYKEFANYSFELFNNNALWTEFRNNLINIRGKKNWLQTSAKLLKDIFNE